LLGSYGISNGCKVLQDLLHQIVGLKPQGPRMLNVFRRWGRSRRFNRLGDEVLLCSGCSAFR
jgi:hypothetical protein